MEWQNDKVNVVKYFCDLRTRKDFSNKKIISTKHQTKSGYVSLHQNEAFFCSVEDTIGHVSRHGTEWGKVFATSETKNQHLESLQIKTRVLP